MLIEIAYLADHPEFIPEIAAWYFAQWGHREPGNSVEQTRARLMTRLNRDRLPIPIVALEGGRLLGAAQLKRREMPRFPQWEFWLGSVYVAPPARGRGVGEVLVKRVEQISVQLDIRELYLQTEKLSGGLYAKLGWTPLEQVIDGAIRVLVMRKDLRG